MNHQKLKHPSSEYRLILIICLFLTFFASEYSRAFPGYSKGENQNKGKIYQTASHIVIIQSDLEYVWGSYYFAVMNRTSKNKLWSNLIRLPFETTDFEAGENLKKTNLSLEPDGSIKVSKSFLPGMNLVGLRFKAPIKRGKTNTLTFESPNHIKHLFIATTQKKQLKFKAKDFKDGVPPMLAKDQYSGINRTNIKKGERFNIEISGIPDDRTTFWVMGTITACLLLLILGVIFIKDSRILNREVLS